jgi:Protein of unknown function (DUF3443)
VRKSVLPLLLAALLALAGCFKQGPEVSQTPISISISSSNLSVGIGQSATITAIVYDQNSQGVAWTASPLNFGTLSNATFNPSTLTASVTYTAPSVVANSSKVTVTATSITNPNISASLSFQFSPITIALQNRFTGYPLTAETFNPSDSVAIRSAVANDPSNLGVTWSLSPATGAGSIDVSSAFNASYTAPASVSAATTVILTATSVEDPTVSTSQQFTLLPSGAGPNVVTLNVNGGPVPGQVYPNRAFTTITVCNPGGVQTCETVDGILVDTGSYGLRILQSQIPLLKLPATTDQLGNTLENCATWPDGSLLWGTVSMASVYIGQEGATLNVQLVSSAPSTVPDGCSNGAITNDNTPQLLGANGILGIGPEPTDCTLSGVNYCDGSHQSTPPNVYYACPSNGCAVTDSPVLVNALLQISNPVPLFIDSNGVILQLPAVSDPQASAMGTMTFGIGTESNNSLGSATVFTLDANDNFTTTYNGQTLTNSYIDSGSNALFFPDSLPVCAVNRGFYCPLSSTNLSAINQGATQGQSTVDFSVDNADNLFSSYPQDAVFVGLAGPQGTYGTCSQGNVSCAFDWGLPFFYGRTVYTAIDGQIVSGAPSPPWWAY